MLVTVPQVNPNDEITNDSVNQGPNALAAAVNGHLDDSNIEQLSGTKISAGTTPASVMTDSGNVEKRFDEAFADYVIDGCVWSALSGLNGSMTTGHISVQGKRLTAPAIATHAFTASKDTYVYLDSSGLPVYTGEVANGAAAPVQPANTVQTYMVTTSATAITSVTDVHSRPVASSNIDFATLKSDPNSPLYDTGWVQPLMASNYTSSAFQVRRIGNIVYARGFIAANSGNIPTSTTAVATVPDNMLPVTFELFVVEGTSNFRISGNAFQVQASGSRTSMYVSGSTWAVN